MPSLLLLSLLVMGKERNNHHLPAVVKPMKQGLAKKQIWAIMFLFL